MLTDEKKKILKKIGVIGLIIIGITVIGAIIFKYEIEGEKNMPFQLTKISLVSSVNGIHKENEIEYWNLDLIQNNDIYLNFEKNEKIRTEALIQKISIENIKIIENPKKGELKFYKAINSNLGENNEEDIIENKIEYLGEIQSDLKELKIGNQGGIVGIRCANENIGEYKSSNTEIRIDGTLLKEIGVTEEEINFQIGFDIIIELTSGVKYKASKTIDFPCGNIIEEGLCKKEITELDDITFKRF